MFINEPESRRTYDSDLDAELQFVAGGPNRPEVFRLRLGTDIIGVEANLTEVDQTDGYRTLVWTLTNVGLPNAFHGIPGYSFKSARDREKIHEILSSAFRAYRNYFGIDTSPVSSVLFGSSVN